MGSVMIKINKSQLERLLAFVSSSSLEERLKAVFALTLLQLTPTASREVLALAKPVLDDLAEVGLLPRSELELLASLDDIRVTLERILRKIKGATIPEITPAPATQRDKSAETYAELPSKQYGWGRDAYAKAVAAGVEPIEA